MNLETRLNDEHSGTNRPTWCIITGCYHARNEKILVRGENTIKIAFKKMN